MVNKEYDIRKGVQTNSYFKCVDSINIYIFIQSIMNTDSMAKSIGKV